MTTARPTEGGEVTTEVLDLVPELRPDFVRRDLGAESVVWSPLAPAPTALDPVATVMLDVLDGAASIGDLAIDVHEAVGVSMEDAQRQVTRIVELYAEAGLLTWSTATSTAVEAIESRELFLSHSTPCAENASRLGTVTLNLRVGEQTMRVACDSRRGARKLRDALADLELETTEDAPLAFVFTAPQGLRRNHRLEDRSGFVLSEGRGLDPGLHALASHLTALLPPAPGTVRIQARGIAAGDRTIVCLSPLLYFPTIEESELVRAGLRLIDRLALDIEVASGRISNPEVPWPVLAGLVSGPGHLGTGGTRTADAIVDLAGAGSGPRTPAAVVARIAASGLDGSVSDLLDATTRLVAGAELRTAPPSTEPLLELLDELASPGSSRRS
jgi:hypothetical protein